MPKKVDSQRFQHALDGDVSLMTASCGGQTAKEKDSKRLSLRKVMPKRQCCTCRAHGVTAGRSMPGAIKFTKGIHKWYSTACRTSRYKAFRIANIAVACACW